MARTKKTIEQALLKRFVFVITKKLESLKKDFLSYAKENTAKVFSTTLDVCVLDECFIFLIKCKDEDGRTLILSQEIVEDVDKRNGMPILIDNPVNVVHVRNDYEEEE